MRFRRPRAAPTSMGSNSQVWRRIRDRQTADAGVRTQVVAACMALGIGLALGWTMTNVRAEHRREAQLFAGYAEVGPLGRLEGPL